MPATSQDCSQFVAKANHRSQGHTSQQDWWLADLFSILPSISRAMQGLQQHLRASHDLFDYGFSEDSPMRLPAVSVEVAAGIYNANHTFQSPEASLLGNSASKVSCSTRP